MRYWIPSLVLAAGLAFAQQTPLDQATGLYQRTEYKKALAVLKANQSRDPGVLLLAGKSYFMSGDFKKATDTLNKAAGIAPDQSEIWHWLGKAYGRRAETSSFFTAPKYASDCRQAFEKAVALDSRNVEAMSDLMEYYLEAPGFLGGGIDKAEDMARRIGAIDPVEKQYADAQLALKKGEDSVAEKHLRAAVDLAPHEVGRILDLARFLAHHGRIQESEAAFAQAEELAPGSPQVLFGRAQVYVEEKRNLDVAKQLLERYLAANLTPNDPPRREAERLLHQLPGS